MAAIRAAPLPEGGDLTPAAPSTSSSAEVPAGAVTATASDEPPEVVLDEPTR